MQHPSTSNPFPYNHSLTVAINGFDNVSYDNFRNDNLFDVSFKTTSGDSSSPFCPNPTTRTVFMNQVTDGRFMMPVASVFW
ncbi:MAG: hypothetical protein R2788_19805 [Saprospiraceae bacterium]